jgi:hypothetical protein
MASNQISVAVGIAMVVAGIGLWGVATYAQVQRAHASVPALGPPVIPSPCPVCPSLTPPSPSPATPPAVPSQAAAGSSSSAGPAPSSSAPPAIASASSTPAAPPGDAASGPLFLFEPGKVVFKKEEIPKILAFGREQLKQPQVRLVIEGAGDEDGPRGLALGRSRSVVARQLLVESGVDSERLVLAPPRAFTSIEDAGVRLRLVEAKSP